MRKKAIKKYNFLKTDAERCEFLKIYKEEFGVDLKIYKKSKKSIDEVFEKIFENVFIAICWCGLAYILVYALKFIMSIMLVFFKIIF